MNPDWWTVCVGCASFGAILLTVLAGGYQPAHPIVAGRTDEIWLPEEWDTEIVFDEFGAFLAMNAFVTVLCGAALLSGYRAKQHPTPGSGSGWLAVAMDFVPSFAVGTLFIIVLSLLSILLGQQTALKSTGIEATIWAFAFGILFTNVVLPLSRFALQVVETSTQAPPKEREALDSDVASTNDALAVSPRSDAASAMHQMMDRPLPRWLKLSSHGEWYIKIGLVLLGIDMQTIGSLGAPGLIASWIDTPIVVILSYLFATRVLRMTDRKMAMIVSVGLAVCGSSAATAVVSVVHASEQTLVFVVALLSLFTSVQMIVLPYVARTFSVNDKVIGAWFGGAIDQTGSVVVSAQIYGGQDTVDTAGLVKIIQNALIGIIAVIISVYWIRFEEPAERGEYESVATGDAEEAVLPIRRQRATNSIWKQLWVRFPKFIIGFVVISAALTVLRSTLSFETFTLIKCILASASKWFFIFGFVGAGLETNFFKLLKVVGNVRQPILLYVVGQSLDLLLGFAMAYLAFRNE